MVGSGGREMAKGVVDGCKGLLAKDRLGEQNYPRDITHKTVGNIWLQLGRDLSKKWAKLLEWEVMRIPAISWLP